jgi:hypothetical protein
MAQEFFIKANSLNPLLRMEVINDGRYSFNKVHEFLQDSKITFSMKHSDTGVIKIANQPAFIVLSEQEGCEEKYIICYQWKKRDTMFPGIYEGEFNIVFNGNLSQSGVTYPTGNLKMPIREQLIIHIKE